LGFVRVTQVRYAVEGWGVGELWLDGDRVLESDLPRPGVPLRAPASSRDGRGPNVPQGTPGIPDVSVAAPDTRRGDDFVPELVQRLRRFFAGDAVGLEDVPVELDGLSDFQCSLAETLRAVPRGEVVTYGELAALAGRPGAARAAGTFCARNRLAPFVPCHRVVAADGIGGYGSLGVEYKRRLLVLERRAP
jgi:methylated-DNA-[protein]-cysteine S-methyltransferase